MISRFTHHTIFVTDQDLAKEFYVDKLGFTLKVDFDMGSFRWITVAPPDQQDFELILLPVDRHENADPGTLEQLRSLLAAGELPTGVFHTNDCRGTYEALKAKGVEFSKEPTDQFYGIEAIMKDPFGNWYSLTQPKSAT